MAVATAVRVFSTEDGETIIVKKAHVQFVEELLDRVFSKPSMGYDLFSLAYKSAVTLTGDRRAKLEREFRGFSDWKDLRELLLEYQAFRKAEVIDQMGYDMEEQRKLFKWMSSAKLIKSTPIGYVKQPVFTSLLKGIPLDGPRTKTKTEGFNI
jgi:hypothetical protein